MLVQHDDRDEPTLVPTPMQVRKSSQQSRVVCVTAWGLRMAQQILRSSDAPSKGIAMRPEDRPTVITKPLKTMVPGEGFEPPTFGLQNRCTTTVLTRQGIVSAVLSVQYSDQIKS